VHAFNLADFVTGLKVAEVCSALSQVVKGRRLDDDCNVLLRMEHGAPAEGYLEAFANTYRDFAAAIRTETSLGDLVPSIEAGVRGMAFVKAAVDSSRNGSQWVSLRAG